MLIQYACFFQICLPKCLRKTKLISKVENLNCEVKFLAAHVGFRNVTLQMQNAIDCSDAALAVEENRKHAV